MSDSSKLEDGSVTGPGLVIAYYSTQQPDVGCRDTSLAHGIETAQIRLEITGLLCYIPASWEETRR